MNTELQKWLMEADTPSIRYQTLIDLMGYAPDHPQVIQEQVAIMNTGIVPIILSRQSPTGQWENEHSYYTPKYVSTHWSMMLLVEFSVDEQDEHFQRGVDYMLQATAVQLQERIASHNLGWSCLWGKVLRYALYAGRVDDPRVEMLIDYAVRDLNNGYCRSAPGEKARSVRKQIVGCRYRRRAFCDRPGRVRQIPGGKSGCFLVE